MRVSAWRVLEETEFHEIGAELLAGDWHFVASLITQKFLTLFVSIEKQHMSARLTDGLIDGPIKWSCDLRRNWFQVFVGSKFYLFNFFSAMPPHPDVRCRVIRCYKHLIIFFSIGMSMGMGIVIVIMLWLSWSLSRSSLWSFAGKFSIDKFDKFVHSFVCRCYWIADDLSTARVSNNLLCVIISTCIHTGTCEPSPVPLTTFRLVSGVAARPSSFFSRFVRWTRINNNRLYHRLGNWYGT